MRSKIKCIIVSLFMFFVCCTANAYEKEAADDLWEMSLEELMKVQVTTASKSPEPLLAAPGTVYVITEEEIRRYGWRDVREVMAAIPAGSLGWAFDWYGPSIRGGGARLVQLLIDGREVQNLIADEALIQNAFHTHRIKRIEVLLGAQSTLYGSNAVGGVVNIITKTEAKDQLSTRELQVTRGEVGTTIVNALFRENTEDGYFAFSASVFQSDYNWDEMTEFVQSDELYSRHPEKDPIRVYDKNTIPYESHNFDLRAEMKGLYVGANIWEDRGPQGYAEVHDYWGQRESIRETNNFFIGNKIATQSYDGFVEYSYTKENDYFLEPEWNAGYESFQHRLKTEAHTTVGKHTIVFGYDGLIKENKRFSDVDTGTIHVRPQTRTDLFKTNKNSLFVHDSINIIDNKLKGILGARYDKHKDVDSNITSKTGLIYNPRQNSAIKLIYAEGFRAPNIFENKAADRGNISSLPPVESKMIELAYAQTFSGDNWLIYNNLSLYKNKIEGGYEIKLIKGEEVGASYDVHVLERHDTDTYNGIENMLRAEYKNLSGFLGLLYTDHPKTEVAGERILKGTPKYSIRSGLSGKFFERVTASAFIIHSDKVKSEANTIDYSSTEVFEVSSWTTVNMNVRFGEFVWGQSQIGVAVHVENLFDKEYFKAGGRTPIQILQPPRTFRITGDLKF